MNAQRVIIKTDDSGKVKNMPMLAPNRQFEAIILDLEQTEGERKAPRRCPHPDIAGRLQIAGDIVSTVGQSEWDLPR